MTDNRWAIIDNNGVIWDGPEDEVRSIWVQILDGRMNLSGDIEGDLKLVEIHGVTR